MFCKHCGFELPEDSKFCPKCGKVNDVKDEYSEDNYTILPEIEQFSESSIITEEMSNLGGRILKNAILGLGFSLSFYFSPLGLIFAIVSKILCGRYIRRYGETSGKASVGKGIGIAALATGIVFTAILLLYGSILLVTMLGIGELSDINIHDSFTYNPYDF